MPVEPGFQALEQRRQALDAIRENSSRHAECQVTINSHGAGEIKLPDVARFTCTFVYQPAVVTGFSIDGDALVPTRFPRVTCGVYKWLQDTSGFYIGAWVFVVVDTQSPYIPATTGADPGYDLIHNLTFSGLAIKALPAHLLDD